MMIQDDPALEQDPLDAEPEPVETAPDEGEPAPVSADSPTFRVGDEELTEAELADSVRLYKILQSDADARDAIALMDQQARESGWGSVRDRLVPPQVPSGPQPEPEDDEWVDPAIREMREELAELKAAHEQRAFSEMKQATDAGIDSFFQGRDDLDQGSRGKILETVRELGLVTSQLMRFPEHQRMDAAVRTEAVRRALDAAYRIEFFDQAGQQAAEQTVADISRRDRQRIPASAPARRAAPEPRTPQERQQAITDELRNYMQGGPA